MHVLAHNAAAVLAAQARGAAVIVAVALQQHCERPGYELIVQLHGEQRLGGDCVAGLVVAAGRNLERERQEEVGLVQRQAAVAAQPVHCVGVCVRVGPSGHLERRRARRAQIRQRQRALRTTPAALGGLRLAAHGIERPQRQLQAEGLARADAPRVPLQIVERQRVGLWLLGAAGQHQEDALLAAERQLARQIGAARVIVVVGVQIQVNVDVVRRGVHAEHRLATERELELVLAPHHVDVEVVREVHTAGQAQVWQRVERRWQQRRLAGHVLVRLQEHSENS